MSSRLSKPVWLFGSVLSDDKKVAFTKLNRPNKPNGDPYIPLSPVPEFLLA